MLQAWIDLHDHTARLYERSVETYENTDPATLLPGYEQARADHFASLVRERDRYRQGAEEGRALQRRLALST
jgi:hypothetical protein